MRSMPACFARRRHSDLEVEATALSTRNLLIGYGRRGGKNSLKSHPKAPGTGFVEPACPAASTVAHLEVARYS
jgi:hypothetical protein